MKLISPFYISLFGGILIWLLVLMITPVNIQTISNQTILFISLSYLFMVLGYHYTKFTFFFYLKIDIKNKLIPLIIIIYCAFLIRYIDLFFFRGLNFYNAINYNKYLASNSNYNLLFIISTVIKEIYFIPLIIILATKVKNKYLLILALLLFLLPFPEAILRGSRRIIFQPILLSILILFYTKSTKLNWKNGVSLGLILILLFSLATILLIKRESAKDKDVYTHLIKNARYNDLLKPKNNVVNFIENEKNSNFSKSIVISSMQIGQYYTHGIFEFDYVMNYYNKNRLEKQLGKFTFFVIPKFTNKIRLTKIDLNNISKSSPRVYTFISFFGGLFIDFGWFAIIFMFLLGSLQKIIFTQVKSKNIAFYPIFIFLIFVNFFMLTFNFFKGTGTYTLISCLIFALILSSPYKKIKNNLG